MFMLVEIGENQPGLIFPTTLPFFPDLNPRPSTPEIPVQTMIGFVQRRTTPLSQRDTDHSTPGSGHPKWKKLTPGVMLGTTLCQVCRDTLTFRRGRSSECYIGGRQTGGDDR